MRHNIKKEREIYQLLAMLDFKDNNINPLQISLLQIFLKTMGISYSFPYRDYQDKNIWN